MSHVNMVIHTRRSVKCSWTEIAVECFDSVWVVYVTEVDFEIGSTRCSMLTAMKIAGKGTATEWIRIVRQQVLIERPLTVRPVVASEK